MYEQSAEVVCCCSWPGTGTRYDTSSDGGGESGIVTTRRFPMPYAQPNLSVSTIQQGGSNADWYSYNYGPSRLTLHQSLPACLPACVWLTGMNVASKGPAAF